MLIPTLKSAPVVPLIQASDTGVALKTARALLEGGLKVHEVVLRTDEAFECLGAIAREIPDAIVGAGTVLSADQARRALDCGATFIVSPGLGEDVVKVANDAGVPVLPGIATATELQRAWNLGLRTVKFFPAGLAGGPKMLKALSSVFRDVAFMPTGGVNADTLADYLAVPAVLACGGSWLTPKEAIDAGDFEVVTTLATDALHIAASR